MVSVILFKFDLYRIKQNTMATAEFNQMLMQNADFLKPFAVTLTKDQESAKDLLQETMYRALANQEKYSVGTNIKAWLYTIMRNIFINQYRRKVKSGTIFDHSQDLYLLNQPGDSLNSPIQEIAVKEISGHIDRLEEEYSVPFKMHFKGFKYKEISHKLGIPIGTVKSRIFIARKKLMEVMPEYNYSMN